MGVEKYSEDKKNMTTVDTDEMRREEFPAALVEEFERGRLAGRRDLVEEFERGRLVGRREGIVYPFVYFVIQTIIGFLVGAFRKFADNDIICMSLPLINITMIAFVLLQYVSPYCLLITLPMGISTDLYRGRLPFYPHFDDFVPPRVTYRRVLFHIIQTTILFFSIFEFYGSNLSLEPRIDYSQNKFCS